MNSGIAGPVPIIFTVGVVGRPVGVADQGGQLVAQREHLGEQRLVLRPAALEERDRDARGARRRRATNIRAGTASG